LRSSALTDVPALLASLNMLLMTSGGYWMREAGFHGMRIVALTSEISMVIGIE
jgi:hypothetical protein